MAIPASPAQSPLGIGMGRSLRKWRLGTVVAIALYLAACLAVLTLLPDALWESGAHRVAVLLGLIGLWRYLWWLTHLVRAQLYERRVFPLLRARAQAIWDAGWRPRRVHFLMTTFRERRETARAVVAGLCRELRATGRTAVIWIGSAEAADEAVLVECFEQLGADLDLDLRIIRQNQPGKRAALALLLRAVSREALGKDDIVAFMDGDFVLEEGALTRCLPLFAADPSLHAVTTDEEAIVVGSGWMQSWLSMRFAQRRIAMQSHSLSGRVLTLTGRFSVFRAAHIGSEEFIRLVEADHLSHWLWGTFRFLSGDDKSTWYGLLRHGVRLLYVPDAKGHTIEVVDGPPLWRLIENLRRWSGNTLRNGWRAIRLGPRRMPLFIWWCLIDQRIAIWTTLLGVMLVVAGTIKWGLAFLIAAIVYIALTRLFLALVLFAYAPRVDLNMIWCLYLNQTANALVKLYMLWRLPRQRWSNRGDQSAGLSGAGLVAGARTLMAGYLTLLSAAGLALLALLMTGLLELPVWDML